MGLGATLPNHIPACRSEFKGVGVLRIERKSCHMQLQGKHSNDCYLKRQTHLFCGGGPISYQEKIIFDCKTASGFH